MVTFIEENLRLDLGCALLVLCVGHFDVQLSSSRLDGVPPCESRREMNVSGHTEISRVDDFVGGWVVENGLGVNTSLQSISGFSLRNRS